MSRKDCSRLKKWLYPELAICASGEERLAALREADRPFEFFIALLVSFLLVVLVGLAALRLAALFLGWYPSDEAIDWLYRGGAILCLAMASAIHRVRVRKIIRDLLSPRGVMLCSSCGYDLMGLPPSAPSCPECGSPISKRFVA
ncbi:MAG: hypothetical protein EA376_13315 [Phycisphaeraceae bacterium]|nr:MAG: hypothetical protein EA376_13315 [Phycisphaeraceae bacterium]